MLERLRWLMPMLIVRVFPPLFSFHNGLFLPSNLPKARVGSSPIHPTACESAKNKTYAIFTTSLAMFCGIYAQVGMLHFYAATTGWQLALDFNFNQEFHS